MEKNALKRNVQKHGKGQQGQSRRGTIVVRKYEPADKPQVQLIFYEGLMEMVQDTAFRGLRHHQESVLLYAAVTGEMTAYMTYFCDCFCSLERGGGWLIASN